MKTVRMFLAFFLAFSLTMGSAHGAIETEGAAPVAGWGLKITKGTILVGSFSAAFLAGLNLQQVSQSSELEHCKQNSTEFSGEPCEINQFYEFWNQLTIGFLAILGTLAPSADSLFYAVKPVALLTLIAKDLKKMKRLYGEYKPDSLEQSIFEGVTTVLTMAFAIYEGYYYGAGDQYGAKTVGETVDKTSQFNDFCAKEENHELCATHPEEVYYEEMGGSWLNHEDMEFLGLVYLVLNRAGSFTVGYALGYGIATPIKETIQEGVALIPGSGIKAPTGHIAFRILNGIRTGTTLFILLSPWNPVKQYSAPLFNTVEYNKIVLKILNNTDISYNKHGILHHNQDPNASNYTDLSYADSSAQFLLDNDYITELQIAEIIQEQEKSGVGLYEQQYHLISAAAVSNPLGLPQNLASFTPRANTVAFLIDAGWNAFTLLCLIPYNMNLASFIATKQANETQSFQAVILKSNNQTSSEKGLLQNEKTIVIINGVTISFGWGLNIYQRFSNLHKVFVSPDFLQFEEVSEKAIEMLESGVGAPLMGGGK